ncbi:MAG: hypothetical protein NT150_08435 [Bacteroidetes bacterium]|nr:hypothetical protein [Bacteroidota bacterium]
MDNKEKNTPSQETENQKAKKGDAKKKISLDDLKLNSFISEVDVDDMQFLNTAGG